MSGEQSNAGVRTGKIRRPVLPGDHLSRPRMHARLQEAIEGPATLVCAPPGNGKTALVSTWAESCGRPVAWLTLDADDADAARLAAHLIAAIEKILPGACARSSVALGGPALPPLPDLVDAIVADLESLSEPFVLVLHQYHLVNGGLLPELVTSILLYPPDALHLVIVTQREPDLPLQDLRARRRLGEIRQRDLALTLDETAALLEQSLGRSVDRDTVAELHRRFEGWVTGLALFALARRRRPPESGLLAKLPEGVPEVDAYLRASVFDQQPTAVQHFLLRCSILERFTAPICEAVAAPLPDALHGRAFLEHAWSEQLFLLRLDGEEGWFRFQRPLRKFLQNQLAAGLSDAEIRELHDRAARELARLGHVGEAVDHALRGKRPSSAARILGKRRIEMLNAGRWHELLEIASRLPEEVVESDLDTLLLTVWITPPGLMSEAVARVERTLAAHAPPKKRADAVRGELELMQAGALLARSAADSAELPRLRSHAEEAVAQLPVGFREARAMGSHLLAQARQMSGDLAGAIDALDAGLAEHVTAGGHPLTVILYAGCIVQLQEANLVAARDAAQRCIACLAEEPVAAQNARRILGTILYQWNELESAEEVLRSPAAQGLPSSMAVLAQVLQAQGRSSEADALITELVRIGKRAPESAELLDARAPEALQALRQGRGDCGVRWAESTRTEQAHPFDRAVSATLIRAQILIAAGSARHRETAAVLLALLRDVADTRHSRKLRIEVLALESLHRASLEDEAGALAALQESIESAAPGGFVRLYLDLGPEMRSLLARVQVSPGYDDYLARIRAAFLHEPMRPARNVAQPLPDPLTDRELEILALIAQRLANKEIAARLFLSTETVKSHASTIYQKLNVHSRRAAAEKAIKLGLIAD